MAEILSPWAPSSPMMPPAICELSTAGITIRIGASRERKMRNSSAKMNTSENSSIVPFWDLVLPPPSKLSAVWPEG